MNIPEPITHQEKELYNAYRIAEDKAYWARRAYLALFPKRTHTGAYDRMYEEIADLIDTYPPRVDESPTEYHQRLGTHIPMRLIGIGLRDMGYERVSRRTGKRVYNVWTRT